MSLKIADSHNISSVSGNAKASETLRKITAKKNCKFKVDSEDSKAERERERKWKRKS